MKGLNQHKVSLLLLSLFTLVACNYKGNTSGLHYFLDMHDSLAVEAQEEDHTTLGVSGGDYRKGADNLDAYSGPGSSIRVPPEGTVPRNYEPYPYEQTEIELAGSELRNPLRRTKAVLSRGQDRYETFCAVCHGHTGKGDGPVVPRFQAPPTLVSLPEQAALTEDWADGKLFHMMTTGRGRMKSYAAQLSVADRWAVVHYIRLLQAKN